MNTYDETVFPELSLKQLKNSAFGLMTCNTEYDQIDMVDIADDSKSILEMFNK